MSQHNRSLVTRWPYRRAALLLFTCVVFMPIGMADEPAAEAYGLDKRVPWTGSRLVGSPDPPLPYVATPTFEKIQWDRPLYIKREPGGNYLILVQQGGEADKPSRLLRFEDRSDVTETSVLLEIPKRLVYGIEFHPDYARNGQLYVFTNGPTGEPERQNRISRYTIRRDASGAVSCDPNSEEIILQWRSMGHDGGDLCFGHDGMLYISSGDGTSDSDNWLSAQDVTNLLGGVLRIDVEHPADGQAYSIPSDNPFVGLPEARGELWAIGLRNPWRMSIDAGTGQIWVGNNGQDMWETAHLLGRGENYGWSVYEGSHPFYSHRKLGPGVLTLPTFEHHHSEARSLTGGVVYDGDRLPDLKGAYIYGDYSTGKIWAGRHDGTRVIWHREIADTPIEIAGFSNSHQGELLVVDRVGAVYRLQPNPLAVNPDAGKSFPRRLSETGLFTSVVEHIVAPGVIPYSVNVGAWNDGATVERFLAIPEELQVEYSRKRGWNFPEGSVLWQTLSHKVRVNGQMEKRRLETRLLLRQQKEWTGYTYLWNSDQSDAELVDRDGLDIAMDGPLADSDQEAGVWRVPSRAECMSCHSRAVNYVLGLTEFQMNRLHTYGDVQDNQLRTLEHIGMFREPLPAALSELEKLVDPFGSSEDLEARVKSYLHTNCSSCHVQAGGGNSRMALEFNTPLDEMQIVAHFPQHDTFGMAQPRIIAPGSPDDSVMLARLERRGRGQMPPLVSHQIDEQAVSLIRQWVSSLKPERSFVREWKLADLEPHLSALSKGRSFERGEQLFRSTGCGQCHRIKDEFAGIGPNLTGLSKRLKVEEIVTSMVHPSQSIAEAYAMTIVLTVDGEILQGRVEHETDDAIVLRSQESLAAPQTIAKEDIEQRKLSTISMMPEGTLNRLQLDEILDLLAYILADANPDHEAFQE